MPIVIKGDLSGSVEALTQSILSIVATDEKTICKPDIVFTGIGDVTSSDVSIAAASKAKVIAFNVAANMGALEESKANNVEIMYFNIIYDVLDDLEKTIKTILAPPPPGQLIGRASIQKIFKLGKSEKAAGVLITEGFMRLNSNVRILRGSRNVIYDGKLSSLKVFRDEVAEVPQGSECGIAFNDFSLFMEGDVIECFSLDNSGSN